MDEDHRLINAVLNGNQNAFRQLVERYQNFVFTITFRVLKSREEAEEAAQDVFIKVIRTLKKGSYNEEGKFLPWVLTISHNLVIDHFRKSKKMGRVSKFDSQRMLQNDV